MVTYLAFVAVLAFLALGRLQESVEGHETESQEDKYMSLKLKSVS